jgi:hypothetical protein
MAILVFKEKGFDFDNPLLVFFIFISPLILFFIMMRMNNYERKRIEVLLYSPYSEEIVFHFDNDGKITLIEGVANHKILDSTIK